MLLLFAIALHAYYVVYPQKASIAWTAPFQQRFLGFIGSSNFLKVTFAVILILIQAYLVNDFVIKHKLSRALSTIPAATFVLFAAWVLESDIFQPVLIANLFCVLSIGSLFKTYKRHLPISDIFNSGFFMAIAAVLYPPYLFFLIVLLLGLFSLRNLNIRESLQLLSGIAAPYFLLGVFLFYSGQFKAQYGALIGHFKLPTIPGDNAIILMAKPLICLPLIVFIITIHNSIKKKKKFDAIKKIELCYWMLLIGLPAIVLSNPLQENHLMMISIPIAILVGLVLENKNNSVIKEFVFLLAVATYAAFMIGIV